MASGQTLGFDVDGGILPTPVFHSAHGADPAAGLGRKRLIHRAAHRTDLRGGGVASHLQQLLTLPLQLVTEQFPEHPEAGIPDRIAAQLLGNHLEIIVPDTHGVPSVGYPPGFLMQEVASLIGDVFMEQPVLLHQRLIVFRAGLQAAQLLLDGRGLFLRLFQPAGRVGGDTIVGHIEMSKVIFQADGSLRCGLHWLRFMNRTGKEQVAIILSRLGSLHRDSSELPAASWTAGEGSPNQSGLGHADSVSGDVNRGAVAHNVVAGGETVPIILLPLVLGIAKGCRIAEEIAECLGKLLVFLRQCLIVHFSQERELLFIFCRGGDEMLVRSIVELLMVGEHLIPDIPAASESLLEQFLLSRCGVEPDFDGVVLNSGLRLTGICVALDSHSYHLRPNLL